MANSRVCKSQFNRRRLEEQDTGVVGPTRSGSMRARGRVARAKRKSGWGIVVDDVRINRQLSKLNVVRCMFSLN